MDRKIKKVLDFHAGIGIKLRPIPIYKASDGVYISSADAHVLTGVSKQTMDKRIEREMIDPIAVAKPSTIQLYSIHDIMATQSKGDICDDDADGDETSAPLEKVSIEEAKRRTEIERVKNLRLKNAQLIGELIPADQVDRELATQAALHISLLRNEQSVFPNILENKKREEIESIVMSYHHEEISRLGRILEKRSKEDIGAPVMSDLIYGILEKLDDGDTIESMMDALGIEYSGDEEHVQKRRYSRKKTSLRDETNV